MIETDKKESELKYHIAISRPCDLEDIARNAQAKKCPMHIMWEISQLLGASVDQPEGGLVLPLDRMRAKIAGSHEQWALARRLSSQLQEDDVIYCTGEDVGFPIAALCGNKKQRPKIVVFIHNINRLRSRVALKLFHLADRIDLFVTSTPNQADFLRRYLFLPENRIYLLQGPPIDISFFTPGPASQDKLRPVIGGGGLEKRDYKTLADATRYLDVDVKICAFSPNAVALKQAFPKVMPSNMSFRFYNWCELVQLYRDSDLVVITLFQNNYQAGLTTMLEAMACRRPIVITRSPGIIQDLANLGIVTAVNPNDPVGLKQAIESLLNDPKKALAQAQEGYELVIKHYNHNKYIEALVTQLTSRNAFLHLNSPSQNQLVFGNHQ